MARLTYIARDDLPEDKHPVFDRIAERRGGPESGGALPHSFALLLNSPDAAEAVGALGEYVRFRSPLDPAAREIAILAAAMEMGSDYVWKHHEPVARRAGVRDATIEAIRSGRAPMGLPAKEGVFAQAAREIVRNGTLTDRTFQAIHHLLGAALTVDLVVAVTYYVMLARALGSLGVDLEDELHSAPGLP